MIQMPLFRFERGIDITYALKSGKALLSSRSEAE
jgi:hypothetical protein